MAFPFRRKRTRRAQVRPAEAHHLFDAVPEIAEGVLAEEDSRECLQLKLDLPSPAGVPGVLARALHFRSSVRVNLDERGTLFWQLIDGRRALGDIEEIVRERWQMDEKESRRATVLFTKMLMARRLLNLRVARPDMSRTH